MPITAAEELDLHLQLLQRALNAENTITIRNSRIAELEKEVADLKEANGNR